MRAASRAPLNKAIGSFGNAMDFANALFMWNDWVVFPALTLATLVLHLRRRKPSTLLLFVGLVVLLAGRT